MLIKSQIYPNYFFVRVQFILPIAGIRADKSAILCVEFMHVPLNDPLYSLAEAWSGKGVINLM